MDHNILLEQVNRLITEPFRESSIEFYDGKTICLLYTSDAADD